MENKTITINIPVEFKRLFDTDWREAAVYGGRFSLKSHTVARVLLIKARMNKIRVACFREFQNSISDSSYQLLSDLIRQYELTDFEITNNSIINKINGSDFIFKGLWNNEQSIKSIEGIDIAWIEEAQTVSSKSLEVLTPTVRKDGSQIIYTYNRLLEEDPVHKRLVLEGRPNTLIINVNYDIAIKYKMIPDVIMKEIEDDKAKRPALYKHKWLGEPQTSERKIYKDWQIIDEIPHEARLERRGLDFGFTNDPTVIEDIYAYNGGIIIDQLCYQKGLSNKSIADVLTANGLSKVLVIADSAEPKSIDEISNYGVNIIGAIKGPGSVRQGIQFVQDQKISLTRRSLRSIEAYQNYIWRVDMAGNQINEPDDTIHEWSNACLIGNTEITISDRSTKKIRDIKIGDKVLTSQGNREVTDWALTQKKADVYKLELLNGSNLIATGNHRVLTERGEVAIDSLRYDDKIIVLNTKQKSLCQRLLSLMGKSLECLVNTISPHLGGRKVKGYYTESYGNITTEKHQKVIIFTTLTKIGRIMIYLILNLKKSVNTIQNILKKCGATKSLEKKCCQDLTKIESLLKNGILAKQEENGTANTVEKVGLIEKYLKRFARFAERNILPHFQIGQNTATRIVKLKHCGQEDVYNITVEKEHNYYANGILVKNCDAIRYGLDYMRPRDATRKPFKQQDFDNASEFYGGTQ